jgi:addiction module RelB/DinJ family antitoxin
MTGTARIQTRTDPETKERAARLFAQMGMDTGTAINMFLAQCVNEGRLPFQPSVPTPFEQAVLETESEPILHADSIQEMKDIITNA